MLLSRSTWAASTALASLLLLNACGGSGTPEETAPAEQPAEKPAEAEAPAADASTKIDFAAASSRGKTAMFVPAPSEFQIALAAAEVTTPLGDRLGTEGNIEGKSKPVVALETGRRIANVLLASKDGTKDAVLARMKAAKAGLAALGAGESVLGETDKLIADYEAGTIGNAELPPSMDLLNQKVQKALNKGAGEEVATLVQAGGWVQGVHLLSTVLSEGAGSKEAPALVHQPSVLGYFTEFIKNSSAAKAGDEDVVAVIVELDAMSEIAKKETLANEDLKAVAKHTGNIIARF
ncbi:MAG: hypothetical protein KDA24_05625 [Deltaproteobacteria bacterium]|nr:hypothetical protein [Deltaproteobacteria bacterium]